MGGYLEMRKKVLASLLVLSMIGSLTGCSKLKNVTSDDFIDACENTGADEMDDVDELRDLETEDFADGVYLVLDGDDIEELPYEVLMMLKMYDFDLGIDTDDMEEVALYMYLDQNIDDIDYDDDPEAILDLQCDIAFAAHITLSDPDLCLDAVDGIEDLLRNIDVDVDDLTSEEYYTSRKGGVLRLHVALEDLIAAFLDSDSYDVIEDMSDIDNMDEILEQMTGDVSLSIYIENENIVIIAGLSVNETNDSLISLCDELGLDDPNEMESSQTVIDALIEKVDDYSSAMAPMLTGYIEAAEEAAEAVAEEGF